MKIDTAMRSAMPAWMRWLGLVCLSWSLWGCATGVPEGLQAVGSFDVQRYQGRWYEIARLDHRFERGLSDVTARYEIQSDASVRVINRGFDAAKGRWQTAQGRAQFLGEPDVASLKVSFFGPFYGGYHVIALDPAYRWAMVAGPDRSYLWILAREPRLDAGIQTQLKNQAQALGFDTSALIWVEHNRDQQ